MNSSTVQMNLADIYCDGSDGEYLAQLLECLRLTLNTAFSSLFSNGGGTHACTCDFSLTTFASWNALSSVSSTKFAIDNSLQDACCNKLDEE